MNIKQIKYSYKQIEELLIADNLSEAMIQYNQTLKPYLSELKKNSLNILGYQDIKKISITHKSLENIIFNKKLEVEKNLKKIKTSKKIIQTYQNY